MCRKRTHQGNGCPIKREELTKLTTKSYNHRSLPGLVINEATEKLSRIFGYELKEFQRSRPSSNRQTRTSQQSFADSKSYILESKLPSDVYKKYVEDKGTSHIFGFTFVVISIVHLAGGKIPEENLWHHLRRMGFSESDENHCVFGNTKQTIDSLVQQRFLQKEKVNGAEGNVIVYELAERALEGSVYAKLKDYIVEVRPDTNQLELKPSPEPVRLGLVDHLKACSTGSNIPIGLQIHSFRIICNNACTSAFLDKKRSRNSAQNEKRCALER